MDALVQEAQLLFVPPAQHAQTEVQPDSQPLAPRQGRSLASETSWVMSLHDGITRAMRRLNIPRTATVNLLPIR